MAMRMAGEADNDHRRGYRFGDFTLDIDRASLFLRGKTVPLRPQCFDVLRYLVERHGHLVSKQELLEAIWGKTVVTDDSLTHCLIEIRKALGDNERTLIRTVPRRGYIFDTPAEPIAPSGVVGTDAGRTDIGRTSGGRVPRATRIGVLAIILISATYLTLHTFEPPPDGLPTINLGPIDEHSVAVLPFVDMSETREHAYFGDGLAEEILNSLARNSGLRVTARTSSFNYRDTGKDIVSIARELRVANVLEGSVRVAGDRAVVTAQLVSGKDGMHRWSDTFDRELGDSVDVQRQVAQAVAGVISTEIGGGGESATGVPINAEAYDAYLRARFLFHRRARGDLDNARELFRQATEREPNFARAWAGLAGIYFIEYGDTPSGSERHLQKLKAAAERAVAIDQNLAEGWLRLAGYYWFTGDLEAAERHFSRALEAQPNDPLLLAMMAGREARAGNMTMAVRLQRQALERDPLSAVSRGNLSFYLLAAGEYEEAIRVNRMAGVLHPETVREADTLQGHALIKLGRYADALELIEAWPPGPEKHAAEAMARLAMGQTRRARPLLRRLAADHSLNGYLRFAELRAFCIEIDEAFDRLDAFNAALARTGDRRGAMPVSFMDVAWSPFFASIREDPRWHGWLDEFRALMVPANESGLAASAAEPAVAIAL